ncbi:uncharacterized protein BDR25DRAFT_225265 [Lindgomyces ingoldianus]|uniref:Uncharacterized protein n=1 Tax=Lindgomyces ingoldianus TaxID=673940 RepID=A0ACB6QWI7_9PLEO|nr:uncharacterized protein BDR25DRAFT_225265 [Lindgomyces ingoldianus]KAF2470652.1 hypothetical protein BDR25DRAFT_225265 [Lindgomyces ingoldianus]
MRRRGSDTKSLNPFAEPVINPNYLTTDFDTFAIVQVMKNALVFLKNGIFADYVAAPYSPLADLTTDEEFLNYTENGGIMIDHEVGTSRMSPSNASWGVVDRKLLVKGTSGLRIVNASIFPSIPECHTQDPTYIVAEKGATMIIAAHRLRFKGDRTDGSG